MMHLLATFGDVNMIEKAAKAAMPNLDELKRLQTQLENNEKELKRIHARKESLLDAVELGNFDPHDIKERMTRHKEHESLLLAENANIKAKIEKIPDAKDITRKARLMIRVMVQIAYHPSHLRKMTFDEKRAFLQVLFAMSNINEKRPDIYLKKFNNDNETSWLYTIKGNLNLVDNVGHLPMSPSEKRDLFKWYYEDELNTENSQDEIAACLVPNIFRT
jgi:septal ring factor EnvC (AmiA/AmiB activator)